MLFIVNVNVLFLFYRPSNGCHDPQTSEVCLNGGTGNVTKAKSFFDQIVSSWTDTQHSVNKVLEHLMFGHGVADVFLEELINEKFVDFYHDITEECGVEDKQHSWAVIEKPEEILMYGPYYPNYKNGEHSEDIIIKHTQELLESEEVCEDWSVYIFTQNSPCLARNTNPCMLNLVQKACEWYTLYGLRTRIGYVKCWGFKGIKENLFRDLSFSQLDCINVSHDYERYVKVAQESTENNQDPLCEDLYSAIKHLLWGLEKGNLRFPLMPTMQEQDKKTCFKSMYNISDSEPQERREVLMHEITVMLEAVQLLPLEENGCFEEHLDIGKTFALDYNFTSQVCDTVHTKIRRMFEQCWREMVQDRYAEFLRERLTEDFHRCTVQLFTKDIARFSKEYVQIGRIQFSED